MQRRRRVCAKYTLALRIGAGIVHPPVMHPERPPFLNCFPIFSVRRDSVGRVIFLLLAMVFAFFAGEATGNAALDGPPQRPLRMEPRLLSSDPSVKIDYDIVYVRAPRYVKDKVGKNVPADVWPAVGHPFNLCVATDLMLLHPDGSEEVLVAGGTKGIADPYVSFDAKWVYYTLFHDLSKNGLKTSGGADIYKVNVKTREVVRLTHPQFTPNTGVADWSADFQTPQAGKARIAQPVCNMQPCPLPGGRIVFVSNRDGFKTPRGAVTEALQMFVMDEDGGNVEKIGHLNVAGAQHPVILKDGRIIFSSFEAMGMRGYGGHSSEAAGFWGLWSINPDGTNWDPVVSAFRNPTSPKSACHFQTQLSDGGIVVNNYYELARTGFGTFIKVPPHMSPGTPAFGAAMPDVTKPGEIFWRFMPTGTELLTPLNHGLLGPASGKNGHVTHPCGAPDNNLLLVWTPTSGQLEIHASPDIHGGIYLLKDGQPAWEPGAFFLVKNDPDYNAQWPRPLVPFKRIYGVDEPAHIAPLANDGKLSKDLPAGTPFGLVGGSSLYKRESFPDGKVAAGSVTATGDPYSVFPRAPQSPSQSGKSPPWGWGNYLGRINWQHQGADAGLYDNSEIHAVRIIAMEPPTIPTADKFLDRAGERIRILGEIPVRKFDKSGNQPLDPDKNPDTSFLAKIPADVAWTFQTLDKDGMVLNMAQSWHQVRPGEVRNNCSGCHAHSQKPTYFSDTAAARASYQVFDLAKSTPLLTDKKHDRTGRKWDEKDETGLRFSKGVLNVEYYRDVKPIFERSCAACHGVKLAKPAAGLVLDDNRMVGGKDGQLPATYRKLNLNMWESEDMGEKKDRVYVWHFRSRNSLLTWKIFGRRTDGFPDKPLPVADGAAKHQRILAREGEFKPDIMPPPKAVDGTYVAEDGSKIKVAPLTDEDRRTLVRWIDLGCPIDRDFDPNNPGKTGHGWMLDDQRPTLTLAEPKADTHDGMKRILVGMYDYGTGLDLNTFSVIANFPIGEIPAGRNLADQFKALPDSRWELQLPRPINVPLHGKLVVSIKDRQGNLTRVERTF